jgi:site-specific DNA-cytosine methylase
MASKKKTEMPIATHEQYASDPYFEGFATKQEWIGWYEAIADLIPSLPETELAKWQSKAIGDLPEDLPVLIENTGARSDRDLQKRTQDEPSWTVRAMGQGGHWHRANILTDCKVLAITPQCLARFQSFPDTYILPKRKAIAGMIIGNAVPPLLAQRIMEAF